MQISSNTNYYTPNFKQVNLVQVSKKAFKNPEKFFECSDTFSRTLGKLVNQVELTSLQETLAKCGYSQPIKFLSIIESPGFLNIKNFLEKSGGKSLEWLKSITGINFPTALAEDYHSFIVLTKNEIYHYYQNLGYGNEVDCINRAHKATLYETENAIPKAHVKFAEFMDENFKKVIDNKPIKKFKIESLDELENIVKNLDIIY